MVRSDRGWKLQLLTLVFIALAVAITSANEDLQAKVDELEANLNLITRQLMMQQFYVEEQTRANGNSGLKRTRITTHGTRPYHSTSHVGDSIAAVHDHSDQRHTIGMGEIIAVLNGIEFRTRHNDYKLMMKSRNSTEYGATELLEYPGVPEAVTNYTSVELQAAEMREWFKAWLAQDTSQRDYREYFKPVLCYLEGHWTHSDQDTIEEPFESDRHHFDAKSWLDMQDKIRFTSYSGTKDGLENFAYLPTTIYNIGNDSTPILVQWSFGILCHPLSVDVPLGNLKPVDDLKARMHHSLTFGYYKYSRAARFQASDSDQILYETYLDGLMKEVPGMDNYPGHITEDLMGEAFYELDTSEDVLLDLSRYNRAYRVMNTGAMGVKARRRSFADENVFVAQTTNDKVAGLPIERCSGNPEVCTTWFQRWSYAIPLEIIYLTPLTNWNPYNIEYKGEHNSDSGKTVTQGPNGARNGGDSIELAYDGTNSIIYYRTPLEFFENMTNVDPADTTKDFTNVVDSAGNIRAVRASGHRVLLPNIEGIPAPVRQRYPIMPVHGEGSGVWKELSALTDMVFEPSKYNFMYRTEIPTVEFLEEEIPFPATAPLSFKTGPGTDGHFHYIHLTAAQTQNYLAVEWVPVTTEMANNHTHELVLLLKDPGLSTQYDLARTCDGVAWCADGHHRTIIRLPE